jgi:hypothetical protein
MQKKKIDGLRIYFLKTIAKREGKFIVRCLLPWSQEDYRNYPVEGKDKSIMVMKLLKNCSKTYGDVNAPTITIICLLIREESLQASVAKMRIIFQQGHRVKICQIKHETCFNLQTNSK